VGAPIELPLFPLSTVLFPGGRLDLRVFERRYLDLVRDCTRSGSGFGVCLIVRGREAGAPATPAAFGTVARIVDFATLPDGLLGIVTRGHERFHVERTRVRDNGLVIGHVELLPDDPVQPVPPEYGLLAQIVQRLADQIGGELAQAEQARFDDSAWVAWRLAEILPLEMDERQQLLQQSDATRRLALLAEWLPRFQRH
jgi:Lon protease-like protein